MTKLQAGILYATAICVVALLVWRIIDAVRANSEDSEG